MTSKLDCTRSLLETDSAPNLFCNPPARDPPRVAPAATFAMSIDRRCTSAEVPNFREPPHHFRSPFTQNSDWKHPEYTSFGKRLATFRNWPKYLKGPNKTDLARSGFIYTDIGDRVTCFSCGWTLKDWEPFDDAYKEHMRWSRNCVYANMVSDGLDHWRRQTFLKWIHHTSVFRRESEPTDLGHFQSAPSRMDEIDRSSETRRHCVMNSEGDS